ncbi:hypothetical protein RPE78_01840 [Thioclava litoralis]|uniref:HEPN AbiU2-like domain-containing protein n=1 Tax=Thioclava litoralis TaxID=3076557 RepID=A0ABZ1E064_9RHOB|nr:hypothetical protein RPE78_01840 [Thioclava sp. FTW29]
MEEANEQKDESIPSLQEFTETFSSILRALCVDYAYVTEYLDRRTLWALDRLNPAQMSAQWTFFTYKNSLVLGVAKLLDGGKGSISLLKFIEHQTRYAGWKDFPSDRPFKKWKKSFRKWDQKAATLKIFRDEKLAHNLARGGGSKRSKLSAYKDFEGNKEGKYIGVHREIFDQCLEGMVLLSWLLRLCRSTSEDTLSSREWKELAVRDVNDDVELYRAHHAALLDLVTPTTK